MLPFIKIFTMPLHHSFLIGLTLFGSVASFSTVKSNIGSFRTEVWVASQDVSETETEKLQKVPYSIARGDGSKGGGGLPMPHTTGDDGLTRPKVGAPMPEG